MIRRNTVCHHYHGLIFVGYIPKDNTGKAMAKRKYKTDNTPIYQYFNHAFENANFTVYHFTS
jgi:hypothetical protein